MPQRLENAAGGRSLRKFRVPFPPPTKRQHLASPLRRIARSSSSPTGSTATAYNDTNVTTGTLYVYRVKAINAADVGPQSNYVQVEP